MKKNHNFKTLMTIIITAVVTCSITMLWVYGGTKNQGISTILGNAFASDKLLTKLNLINEKIDLEYMGNTVEQDTLVEGAIKGYVASLGDAYTEYYSPQEMKSYYSDTLGEFVGIGVEIIKNEETNEIAIYNTIPNSPAEEVGILKDDVLIEVDGVPCNGDDFDTITDRIKGKIGSVVNIKVKRINNDRKEEVIDFEITRDTVTMVRVTSQMLEDNIGYIYISTFDGTKVSEQFEAEYDKLVNEGAKSLIVDIRTNGGGIVDEAVEIADLFTDRGATLLIEKDKAGNETIEKAKKTKKINMETVLLVNEFSASASEILAGAVKELADNVTLVGRTTYGKGVIQTLYELADGSGLKLTTNEYYTPNNEKINNKGINPDVKAEDEEVFSGTLDVENDNSLNKAIEILKQKQK